MSVHLICGGAFVTIQLGRDKYH